MSEIANTKRFDLEERTQKFAKEIITFCSSVEMNLANIEIAKQLVRSAGSVGANYIEANEALSKKDFVFRIKICRKEAKETKYWLSLLQIKDQEKIGESQRLSQEILELMKIFGAIIEKSK